MTKKKLEHKYLIFLYSRVDEFLSNENIDEKELPDMIVSFCTTVEKILKIKLRKKNPLLVFVVSRMKDNDSISSAVLEREKNIETINMRDVISRFEIIYKKIFSSDEMQALLDIYEVRNNFVHGYKPDNKIDFDTEDIIKKMGTIWGKISKITIALFGKEIIKKGNPKKKYTEQELENVLIEEVKKKIQKRSHVDDLFSEYSSVFIAEPINTAILWGDGEKCPRCGTIGFSKDSRVDLSVYQSTTSMFQQGTFSDLYKCKKCNLELTKKEYEIAKGIKFSHL